jgi:peroxiredoxin
MVATLCLLTCALTSGQGTEWQLQPQLTRGQELVYLGSFTEEALSPGVQFQRTCKIDSTVLVLEAAAQKFELAFLTVVTSTAAKIPGEPGKTGVAPTSVRLEVVTMDRQGKLQLRSPGSFAPPLEGPPTIECGAFVEVPKGRVGAQSRWDINDEARTPQTWRVEGTEMVNSILCVRLVGVQQSEDWDTPRADRSSWQRRDTIWISPEHGLTYRFERIFERRDAAHQAPTHRSVLRCDLESHLPYPGKLLEERRGEIEQASKFCRDAEGLLREPEQNKTQLEGVLKKIKQYSDAEPPTPYRKAVVQVQKRIEAALRGETIPDPGATAVSPPPRAVVGQRIADFVCTDLLTHQTQRLQRVLGKPVVVMFYNPATENGQRVLRFGQALAERYPQSITIFPMAVTDDPELAQKQHKEMNLPFTILDGNGLVQRFEVDALPRLVVLDGYGVVRAASTGWGLHTPGEIHAEIQKLLPR